VTAASAKDDSPDNRASVRVRDGSTPVSKLSTPSWHRSDRFIKSADGSRANRRKRNGETKDRDEFQRLRAHQREAAPAPPPADSGGDTRTVLAGKDSLRRADARPCLLRSVPADFDLRRAAPAGTSLGLRLLSVVDKKTVDSAGLLMEVADDMHGRPGRLPELPRAHRGIVEC